MPSIARGLTIPHRRYAGLPGRMQSGVTCSTQARAAAGNHVPTVFFNFDGLPAFATVQVAVSRSATVTTGRIPRVSAIQPKTNKAARAAFGSRWVLQIVNPVN
jgi:peroxiredoxin family protein